MWSADARLTILRIQLWVKESGSNFKFHVLDSSHLLFDEMAEYNFIYQFLIITVLNKYDIDHYKTNFINSTKFKMSYRDVSLTSVISRNNELFIKP